MKTVFKVPLVLILLFLAGAALTVYLVTQTTLPHRIVNYLLTSYVESRYDVQVTFGDLHGSLWRDLRVDNITVDFKAAPNRYRLLKIKDLSAYYRLSNILKRHWIVDSLVIVEPLVVMRSDQQGKMLLPSVGGGAEGTQRHLDLEVANFRIVSGRLQLFKLPSTHLFDSIEVIGGGSYADGTAHLSIDSLSLVYVQKNFRLTNLAFEGALSQQTVGIDSLDLVTASSRLMGGGLFPLRGELPFSFNFRDSHVSLDEIAALTNTKISGETDFNALVTGNLNGFGGHAELDGTLFERRLGPLITDYSYSDGILRFSKLRGRAFDGTVAGSIELDLIARPETYTADLTARGLNLNKIVPNTFASNLSGRMEIFGSGLRENSFKLDLQAACSHGSFDFVNFDSLYGTVSLNVNDLFFHPGFTLLYKHSRFAAEGVVVYDGEMYLNGEFHTTRLADFWGDLFIEELSGGASATYVVSGPNLDPDLEGVLDCDSCSFLGLSTDSLKVDFDIESFLYRQKGVVDIRAFKSDVWNLPAESLLAAIEIDSNKVTIPAVKLYDTRSLMEGSGRALLHDSTASVVVDDFLFRFDSLEYKSTTPAQVEFMADRIIVDDLRLAGENATARISCDYGYDTTIDLHIAVDTMPIMPWLMALGVDSLTSGRLNLQGEMKGKLKNPRVAVSAGLDSLSYDGALIGTVIGALNLHDSVLTLENAGLRYRGSNTEVSGTLPLIMDLDSGIIDIPEKEIDLHLTSQGSDLNIVSLALEDLESFTGDYKAEMDVYGTFQRPQSKGLFTLRNGTAKIYEMENPVENIEASLRSEDRRIFVDWVQGVARYQGKSGKIVATGEVEVLRKDLFDFDLQVRGTGVPIKYDLGDIYARCDIDVLEITGSDPPVVSGNIIVHEADYFDEFEEETILAAKEAADTAGYMDYVINVEFLPGSVRVRNSDVNLLLDGQLTVIREHARDNYIGVLEIRRGEYYLLDLTFQIEEGSQIIFDDIENPNPALSVQVYTDIRNYTEGTGTGYHRLYLAIGGTLLQPSIAAAEGSGYSDEDILSLLLWSSPASASGSDALGQTPLEQRVYDYLGRNLSQKLTRTLGVERFEIIPSYGQDQQITGAQISLGFYTTPDLYTYFTSPLALGESAELGFEYRIGRNFYLRGNRDSENLYHLNLNLNWDFK